MFPRYLNFCVLGESSNLKSFVTVDQESLLNLEIYFTLSLTQISAKGSFFAIISSGKSFLTRNLLLIYFSYGKINFLIPFNHLFCWYEQNYFKILWKVMIINAKFLFLSNYFSCNGFNQLKLAKRLPCVFPNESGKWRFVKYFFAFISRNKVKLTEKSW